MTQASVSARWIEQSARVVSVDPEGARVEPVEPGGCGTCGGNGCGARRLAEVFSRKPRNFLVDHRLSLAPGDRVVVGVPEGAVLRAAAVSYGLPLLLLLGGALAGDHWIGGDSGAFAGMLAGVVLAVCVPRRGMRRPVVLRRETVLEIRKG